MTVSHLKSLALPVELSSAEDLKHDRIAGTTVGSCGSMDTPKPSTIADRHSKMLVRTTGLLLASCKALKDVNMRLMETVIVPLSCAQSLILSFISRTIYPEDS